MGPKRQGKEQLPFAGILKQVMTERGLTIRAVAEMAGVSSSVAQSWLNKSNPHNLQAVARLAKALNLSFRGLLLGEPEELSRELTMNDLFDEQDFFEGICKIKIQRLVPRKGK